MFCWTAELQEELPREGGDEREVELDGEGPQPGHGSGWGQRCHRNAEYCKLLFAFVNVNDDDIATANAVDGDNDEYVDGGVVVVADVAVVAVLMLMLL